MNNETIEIPLVKATYEELQQVICELQVERYEKDKEIERLRNEIKKYNDSIRELVLYETILGDKNETIDFYKTRIKKAIKELNNRDYDDGDFESMKFQNHVINILEGNEE